MDAEGIIGKALLADGQALDALPHLTRGRCKLALDGKTAGLP